MYICSPVYRVDENFGLAPTELRILGHTDADFKAAAKPEPTSQNNSKQPRALSWPPQPFMLLVSGLTACGSGRGGGRSEREAKGAAQRINPPSS
jgi:hypothetical protein